MGAASDVKGTEPFTLERPIFTFSDVESLRGYVTGTMADMRALLEGHDVVQGGTYVPFSNGIQRDVMNAFGLRPHPELAHDANESTTPSSRILWKPVTPESVAAGAVRNTRQIAWRRVG